MRPCRQMCFTGLKILVAVGSSQKDHNIWADLSVRLDCISDAITVAAY